MLLKYNDGQKMHLPFPPGQLGNFFSSFLTGEKKKRGPGFGIPWERDFIFYSISKSQA